jgi:hypothetical protein
MSNATRRVQRHATADARKQMRERTRILADLLEIQHFEQQAAKAAAKADARPQAKAVRR